MFVWMWNTKSYVIVEEFFLFLFLFLFFEFELLYICLNYERVN